MLSPLAKFLIVLTWSRPRINFEYKGLKTILINCLHSIQLSAQAYITTCAFSGPVVSWKVPGYQTCRQFERKLHFLIVAKQQNSKCSVYQLHQKTKGWDKKNFHLPLEWYWLQEAYGRRWLQWPATTLLLCTTEKPQILQIYLLVFLWTHIGKNLHASPICAINKAWVPSIRDFRSEFAKQLIGNYNGWKVRGRPSSAIRPSVPTPLPNENNKAKQMLSLLQEEKTIKVDTVGMPIVQKTPMPHRKTR